MAQKAFFSELVGFPGDKAIYDPMAGQGGFLAEMSWAGANVFLGDLNPAVLGLANLRSPALIARAEETFQEVREHVQGLRVPSPTHRNEPLTFHATWLSPVIREQLRRYAASFNLDRIGLPSLTGPWILPQDPVVSLALGLPLLAAREIAAYRRSDNATWLKQGGLQRIDNLLNPLMAALSSWHSYAKLAASKVTLPGRLTVCQLDACSSLGPGRERADLVITSPPYANRLDYTRLWAPEIEVLYALLGLEVPDSRRRQIGTTVVRGMNTGESEGNLPVSIQRVLQEIRGDRKSKASESYYYPFFRNYALSLQLAVKSLVLAVRPGGVVAIFVRDTTRKDTLFPTSSLVEGVLRECGDLEPLSPARNHIVRRHIGLRRRSEGTSLRGLAQQEWWLTYKKVSS